MHFWTERPSCGGSEGAAVDSVGICLSCPSALQTGNVARAMLAEIDMRLPFLLQLLAAISIPLVAQDPRSWPDQQRDSQATIRVTADLVLVPVTVTESSGRPVLGLEKRDFVLTDDKIAQEILSFSREITPVSIGIVFDLSGSMSNKIGKARTAVREFLRYLETGDEVVLVTFNDNAQQRTEFASDDAAVLNELLFARPSGSTALLDAVAMAVRAMRNAHNDRRVLLVISDGEDKHSRLSERELKRVLEETEIQIHALGIHDRSPGMRGAAGPKVLEDLAQVSGGEHHMVNDAGECLVWRRRWDCHCTTGICWATVHRRQDSRANGGEFE